MCAGSNENHDIHEASTIAFMVFSVLHQWMHMTMFIWSRSGPLTQVSPQSTCYKDLSDTLHRVFACESKRVFRLYSYRS